VNDLSMAAWGNRKLGAGLTAQTLIERKTTLGDLNPANTSASRRGGSAVYPVRIRAMLTTLTERRVAMASALISVTKATSRALEGFKSPQAQVLRPVARVLVPSGGLKAAARASDEAPQRAQAARLQRWRPSPGATWSRKAVRRAQELRRAADLRQEAYASEPAGPSCATAQSVLGGKASGVGSTGATVRDYTGDTPLPAAPIQRPRRSAFFWPNA
jgi:hypothetical protein